MKGYTKDSSSYYASIRPVSPEFFDVFKIKFQKGSPFRSDEILSEKQVVASPDSKNKFYNENILETKYILEQELDPSAPEPQTREEWDNAKYIDISLQITGATNKIKRGDFEYYEKVVFYPLKKDQLKYLAGNVAISIRVKPSADKDFPTTFMSEMKEQLSVGDFELMSIEPYSEIRQTYSNMMKTGKEIQSVLAIIIFLLINVFLGILGTFRFRTNSRRGEIGLRCALGSDKSKIRQLFLGETFFLLLPASIIGTIIAINVQLTGILPKLGVPFLSNAVLSYTAENKNLPVDFSALQTNIMTYLITFAIMLIIIWLGTWYPAKKASEIQPAEALHYE